MMVSDSATAPAGEDLRVLRIQAQSLGVFGAVLRDAVGPEYLTLLAAIETGDAAQAAIAYGRVTELLASGTEGVLDDVDAWQSHLVGRILVADNPLSAAAQRLGEIPTGLRRLAAADLDVLQSLYQLNGAKLRGAIGELDPRLASALSDWRELAAASGALPEALLAEFRTAPAWSTLVDALVAWYRTHGSGMFRHRVFRWVTSPGPARLEAVPHADPQRLSDLVGYEYERAPVIENTAQFVAGYPANNVLLAGDRGTGKSSTVKALVNEFGDRGLRLIELSKEHLRDLPQVYAAIRGRPERFILFVDDLSFEEDDAEYKALKAVLEGGVEARPANLLVYATSNRRNLIRERFSDREALDDDPQRRDTYEEKLSLVDRFGIRVLFLAPEQERYVQIATTLAERAGINLPREEIRERAIYWARAHNGRSGRTARHFVNALLGELGLQSHSAKE